MAMVLFNRMGLKARTILGFTLLMLLTVSLLSSALIWHNHQQALANLLQHIVSEGRSIGYGAEPYVLLNDERALKSVLKIPASDKSLLLGRILDTRGRTLAAFSRTARFEPGVAIDPRRPIADPLTRESHRIEQTAKQVTAVTPIWSGTNQIHLEIPDQDTSVDDNKSRVIGYVILVHGLDSLEQERTQAIVSTLIIAGTVLLLGLAASVLLIRQFLSPIEHLAATAQAIRKGDLSRRAPTDVVGEVSVLAQAFNQMADSLSNYTQDLEEQVRRRTLALEHSESEARMLALDAQASNQAKSDFLANMSHEIRTPMTAILGFAESLDSALTDLERHEAISTIRRNGDHLLQIINDILDLSKIEAGKFQIETVNCSPCQMVCEVASLMRVRAESKGLSFTVRYLTPIPELIQTDPTRLRQVLINLVNNAIKFTEHGHIRLEIRYFQEAGADPVLRFDVIDTGIGMDRQQISRLFQPFMQADNSMTRRFGGTGLGLAISKRIIGMLGGEISATSLPGSGSTFCLHVPIQWTGPIRLLTDPEEISSHFVPQMNAAAAGEEPSLHGRILLAEDGLDNQRLISFILKKAGATVDIADNGQVAATRALAEETAGRPYDVILMDMQMPLLDGYEATRLLRHRGYRGPIMALTAHAMAGDREKCLEAGCDEFATKPIDRPVLLATIHRFISKGEQAVEHADASLAPLISELADDPELADLVELFVSELPVRVEAMRAAFDAAESEKLRNLAHQLKGAAGGYGFPAITTAAKTIEEAIKAQAELSTIVHDLDALAVLCNRARARATNGSPE